MYKKIELILLFIAIIGIYMVNQNLAAYVNADPVTTSKIMEAKTVVVDAGHGENDPGKVGVHGELEKDINLEIARCLEKRLLEAGYEVVMTRTDDSILADEDSRNRKSADLKARAALINKTQPFLAVSIHQNSYPDAKVHGAQVFYYSESKEGKKAADILQDSLREADHGNEKEAKANADYYLFRKTEVPTVIVECGFLSNGEEADKLSDEVYQGELADAITAGIQMCEQEFFGQKQKEIPSSKTIGK